MKRIIILSAIYFVIFPCMALADEPTLPPEKSITPKAFDPRNLPPVPTIENIRVDDVPSTTADLAGSVKEGASSSSVAVPSNQSDTASSMGQPGNMSKKSNIPNMGGNQPKQPLPIQGSSNFYLWLISIANILVSAVILTVIIKMKKKD